MFLAVDFQLMVSIKWVVHIYGLSLRFLIFAKGSAAFGAWFVINDVKW